MTDPRILAAQQYGQSAINYRIIGRAYDSMADDLVTVCQLRDTDDYTVEACLRASHEARRQADKYWASFERCVVMGFKLARRATRGSE